MGEGELANSAQVILHKHKEPLRLLANTLCWLCAGSKGYKIVVVIYEFVIAPQ